MFTPNGPITRQGQYTAIWIYDSREVWERLWGPLKCPHRKHSYPQRWQVWEDEILAPFLTQDPDTITFTAYEEVS